MSFALRLSEDRLGAHARLTLPPTPRVVYAQDRAWHTGDAAALATAEVPATFLRFELLRGGEALPATAGKVETRCLLEGALEVTVGDRLPRLMRPGDAWFESGREPVLAKASPEMPTAFVRVSILPREIRGQSSIVYVDPADAARGRPRQYTVYVDEPLVLP